MQKINKKVIYRPQRGSLDEAMNEKKEFANFKELQNYVVKDMKPYIKLRPCEIIAAGTPINDDKVRWRDEDYLCIDKFENINDKAGYIRCFGKQYNRPLCIGMFATDYEKQ